MTKFVRVELENGSKASVPEAVANKAGDKIKVLSDEPALDHRGRLLPVEHPVSASSTPAYSSMNKGPLEALIADRNKDRADESKIVVADSAVKADLIAALEADDARGI